jgi:CO/xanthine dehydrogenase Mo-binding subunit
MKMLCDGGAYGLSTEGVMRKAAILAAGPYVIPNVKVDTIGVYTNNTPSGASVRLALCRPPSRPNPISTFAPSGWDSIRS